MSDYLNIDELHNWGPGSLRLLDSFRTFLRNNNKEYENLISFMFRGNMVLENRSFSNLKEMCNTPNEAHRSPILNLLRRFVRQEKSVLGNEETTKIEEQNNTPDEQYHVRFWNLFERFLRLEVRHCNYTYILHFMCHVFENKQMYDLPRIHSVLKNISIRDDSINLADFCAEFYSFLRRTEHDMYLRQFGEDSSHIYTTEELYNPVTPIPPESVFPVFWRAAPQYIYFHYYGFPEKEELTSNDIDKIAAYAEVPEQLPGLLFPLFCYFEHESRLRQGMYDILENYVFDFYQSYDWNMDPAKADIQANTIIDYFDYLWSCLLSDDNKQLNEFLLDDNKYNNMSYFNRTQTDYKRELLLGDGLWSDFGRFRYKGKRKIGLQFATILDKGASKIQNNIREGHRYTVSYITALTPFLLCSVDEYSMAVDFIINHFADIDIKDRLREWFRITLSRLIFQTDDLEKATILYGYFAIDASTFRGGTDFRKEILDVADSIDSSINLIRSCEIENEQITNFFLSKFDYIMANETIGVADTIAAVRKCDVQNQMIPLHVFHSLFRILDSFDWINGINLTKLGIPKIDGDDKFLYPITEEMVGKGIHILSKKREKHLGRYIEYESIIKSYELKQVCKSVTYLMQDHLSSLAEQQFQEALQSIRDTKEMFSDIDQGDEFEQIKRFDDAINRITRTLMLSQDISHFRHKIANNINIFCEQYLEKTDGNILDHLPDMQREEVISYLCTSTAIYEYLTSIDQGHNSLDYSAVLLPLTKAIEYLLNFIFDRIGCHDYRDETIFGRTVSLKSKTRDKLFENSRKSTKLDFGKYLRILIDYNDVEVVYSRDGTVTLQGGWPSNVDQHPDYRFAVWHGERVLDISKLRLFSEIKFKVSQNVSNNRSEENYVNDELSFSKTDDDYNRMLLYKALDYVRLNYRNPCAHKDPVSRVTADECMKLFFQLEWLLWILIYIIIPE